MEEIRWWNTNKLWNESFEWPSKWNWKTWQKENLFLIKKVFPSSNSLKCKFLSWHLSLMNCLSRTSFFDPIRGYTVFIKQMNSSYFTYFFPLNSTFALKWIIFPEDSITNQFVVDHNTFFFLSTCTFLRPRNIWKRNTSMWWTRISCIDSVITNSHPNLYSYTLTVTDVGTIRPEVGNKSDQTDQW